MGSRATLWFVTNLVVCNCGLIKQSKVGAHVEAGVARCNACGLPIELTQADYAPRATAIPPERIATLPTLPGFRIVRVVGMVTELSAASGFTATMKGTSALSTGMMALRQSAANMGANAVLGVSAATFGAQGGITNAFGGDAVGVLLMGTAVVVEAESFGAAEK